MLTPWQMQHDLMKTLDSERASRARDTFTRRSGSVPGRRRVLALATLVTTVAAVSAVACSSQSTVPSDHPAAATTPVSATLADQLATARQATAAYVNNLDARSVTDTRSSRR
jgi:hypothetical protein